MALRCEHVACVIVRFATSCVWTLWCALNAPTAGSVGVASSQPSVARSARTPPLLCSSVATGGTGGGGARPPNIDRHGHRIRANPRRFCLGEGVVTALPQTS